MANRKISFLQRIGYLLEYAIVVPIGLLVSILPWKIARLIGRFFGFVLYHTDKRDRKIAYQNLDIIYKDHPLSNLEKDTLIKRLAKYVAQYGIEYLKIGSFTKDNYHKFAEMQGYENLLDARKKGKGVIVISLHIGNWDYLGSLPSQLGCNVGVIINRQFNPYTDIWLKDLREKNGKLKCYYNEVKDLVGIVKHLKKGGIIATLNDQTYYFKPIFVPFFGMPSATAAGPAQLHLKFGAPLMIAYSIKQPDGKYIFYYEKAVEFERTDDFDQDCIRVMTWVNQSYEKIILKYPDQWFSLFHPRWERTRPEDFNDYEDAPY